MSRLYVGLDVHCKESVFVIQDEAGTVVGRGSVPTTPEGYAQLREQHALAAGTSVGLETGTMALYSTRLLTRLELKPVVVDAYEVRQKARRPNQKCDQRDAFEICQGLRTGSYQSIVHVPPERVQLLRETLSRRRHFVRQATSEVNAAKRLIRAAGLRHLVVRKLGSEGAWESLLKDLEAEPNLVAFVSAHFAMWKTATEEVAEFWADLQRLEAHAQFAEDARRLQTIPGVGRIVSLTALAVLSDVNRFPTAKHVASYAGLVPSTYHSGEREASGHITKRGSAELRAMLCEAAHHASQTSHPLHPYFSALCARRGYKMAITAVAHRLSRIIFAMLKNKADFDVGQLAIEAGPFEKKRVVGYRRKRTVTSTKRPSPPSPVSAV